MVRAKKHLGQHFLTDLNIAEKIVGALSDQQDNLLEIGPGTGVLTKIILEKKQFQFKAMDVDKESIEYLRSHYTTEQEQFILGDFLKADLGTLFEEKPFAIIGNFPYNISSQILFAVLDNPQLVPELVGMFQKEVAERIAAPHGNKIYGAMSVQLQAFYNIEYLFTVHEHVFSPPPAVKSAVIKMTRKKNHEFPVNKKFFRGVVKTAFNQRRKTLRNSLKPFLQNSSIDADLLAKRPEQLSIDDFIMLAKQLEGSQNT